MKRCAPSLQQNETNVQICKNNPNLVKQLSIIVAKFVADKKVILTMDIKNPSVFGLYSRKENRVTAALSQVLDSGGVNILPSFIDSYVHFLVLQIVLFAKHQLRCREPVAQPSCRVYTPWRFGYRTVDSG